MSATPEGRWLGAVLAGGRSRRFGRDKAAVPLGGDTLLARAVGTLRTCCESVVVVSSRPVAAPEGVRVLPDVTDGLGPLAGLHSALHEAREAELEAVFLLACDLPLVSPAVVRRVMRALGEHPAAAPSRTGGVEPLCAAYSVQVLDAVEPRLNGPDLSLHALFAAIGGVVVDLPEALGRDEPFLNVNTPADLDRARRRLAGREP